MHMIIKLLKRFDKPEIEYDWMDGVCVLEE